MPSTDGGHLRMVVIGRWPGIDPLNLIWVMPAQGSNEGEDAFVPLAIARGTFR